MGIRRPDGESVDRMRSGSAPRPGLSAPRIVLLLLLLFGLSALPQAEQHQTTPSCELTPSMAITPGREVALGTVVAFDASSSSLTCSAELVDEVRYLWDLGDGTLKLGERITHRYTTAGVFPITLTMEVFEPNSTFHRGRVTAEVVVTYEVPPRFVTAIDLEAGFAQLGKFAALYELDGRYVLIGQKGVLVDAPVQGAAAPFQWAAALDPYVLSGAILTVGDARLWHASIGFDLAEHWVGSVGFGMGLSGASSSLSALFPTTELEGHELSATIEQATLVTLGAGYEFMPQLYVTGSVGALFVRGIYEGSARLLVDDQLLPAPFSGQSIVLSLGFGVRLRWAMLSLQALLAL